MRRTRHNPACPACGGPGVKLGGLGNLNHFRCRDCGMDFSKIARARRWAKPRPVKKNSVYGTPDLNRLIDVPVEQWHKRGVKLAASSISSNGMVNSGILKGSRKHFFRKGNKFVIEGSPEYRSNPRQRRYRRNTQRASMRKVAIGFSRARTGKGQSALYEVLRRRAPRNLRKSLLLKNPRQRRKGRK